MNRLRALTMLVVALASVAGVSGEESPYGPIGAPVDPKLPVRWNKFRDYAEASQFLEQLTRTFPDLCRLESLGVSVDGRQMWVMTLNRDQTGKPGTKPAMWIDGGIHANETQAVDVVLYTAWFLAESDGKNPFVTRLLDERTFYLMPMMSPDSRDAHMHEANNTHWPRSGQRPFDDDRDGLVDEDKPDDLDGDGHITMMRVPDPQGRHKPHPDYPALMVPAQPDEPGGYTLLGYEGVDNDGDGEVNEDGDGYYDPNRDWAWNWQPNYIQRGANRYPFSILENRMVADFILAHREISAAQSYHNTGGMILYGPGDANDQFLKDDVDLMKTIGARGEIMLPGYRSLNIAKDLYTVYGGEVDWLYAMLGIVPFTNELFTPFNFFREKVGEGEYFARQEDLHKFDKYLLFGDGTVEWHEVDHPQYGKVEVGGFKKNWGRQPPSFLLEEECHRNLAFTLYHADQMAMVAVDSIETRELEGGLTQVTAKLINQRMIPTHTAQDLAQKITPPDLATLAGPDATVVASFWSKSPIFSEPKIMPRDPGKLKIDNIPGMGAVHARWIVRGKPPFTITLTSVKGGTAERTVPE